MALEPFILLRDPATYEACRWDLRVDHEARGHWVAFFKKHLRTIIGLGINVSTKRGERLESVQNRANALASEFDARYDDFVTNVATETDRVTIFTLDLWRDALLRKHGFIDPFQDLKDDENEKVIHLLPQLCKQLDALSDPEAFRAIIEGVFAGNIFDMGAAGSAQLLLQGKLDFFETRRKLPARPWLVDDFDLFLSHAQRGWAKAVFFIDNAGADFMLGAIPFMRWLSRRGTKVILATNERPTLNDMTIKDVTHWWPRIVETEPSIGECDIQIVSTGTGEPLIDLAGVSPELNAAARGADLVIMEGMGRGVESNLDAEFICDAANLAMIKDLMVAKHLSGKMYDVVCRFR